jgi:hypothetical protein
MLRFAVTLALSAVLAGGGQAQAAQAATQGRPDTTRAAMDHHAMGPWKELNAYHELMGASWHPAEQKNDLAPLRAKIADLVKAADAWGGSKAPAMPHGCGTDAVKTAVAKVVTDTKALAALVASSASDAALKESLKALHDTFEVAERACGGHGDHK